MVGSPWRGIVKSVWIDLAEDESIQVKFNSNSTTTMLLHPVKLKFPNNLFMVPIWMPFINTIKPLTISQVSFWNRVCTPTSLILLIYIRFLSKPRISITPGMVLLPPSYIISQTLPHPTILVSIRPPRTHILLHISHIHRTIPYEVSY